MVIATPKTRTPVKGFHTPGGAKTPKGIKSPKGTPKQLKTPQSTGNVLNASLGGKTPKGPNTPAGKTPKGPKTPFDGNVSTPSAGKTPKGPNTPAGKTPKGPITPAGKTPKGPNTPAAAKTPKGPNTPAVAKTPKGPNTPTAAKTPKGPNTPAAAKTPKGPNTPAAAKTPKGPNTPAAAKTPQGPKTPKGPNTPAAGKTPKGPKSPKVSDSPANGTAQEEIVTSPTTPATGKSPRRKRSASEANLDSNATGLFRSLRIYNLPQDMKQDEMMQSLREILEPRGQILQLKMFKDKRGVQVTYSKDSEARAAKKLNGALMGGRHLTFVHHDDRDMPQENRVVILDIPSDFEDEDAWRLLGNCGDIVSIHMNRNWKTKIPQKSYVTFADSKGMKAALALKQKKCKGKTVTIKAAQQDSRMFPVDSTVFVSRLNPDIVAEDIRNFFSKLPSIAGVSMIEGPRRYAMVYFEDPNHVELALKQSGTKLGASDVVVERHRRSTVTKNSKSVEVKGMKDASAAAVKEANAVAKKLKKNNGLPLSIAEEESDDDDLDDAEEEEDEDDNEVSEGDDDDDDMEEDDDDEDDSEDDEQLLKNFKGAMKKYAPQDVDGADEDDDEEDDDEDDDDEEDEDDDDEEDEDDDDEDDDGDDDDDDNEEDDDDEVNVPAPKALPRKVQTTKPQQQPKGPKNKKN